MSAKLHKFKVGDELVYKKDTSLRCKVISVQGEYEIYWLSFNGEEASGSWEFFDNHYRKITKLDKVLK